MSGFGNGTWLECIIEYKLYVSICAVVLDGLCFSIWLPAVIDKLALHWCRPPVQLV